MKLKYKKAVLMISMGTMFIGLMAFSVGASSQRSTRQANNVASETPAQTKESEKGQDTNKEKTTEDKITDLVQMYFKYSAEKNIDGLSSIVTNIDYVNEGQLKVKYESVEEVKNIECHILDGPKEGTYLVYVYSELKLKDIETLAPGLTRLFIITDDDGSLKVFFGADSEVEEFIKENDETDVVKKLVEKVETRMEEALSQDEDLREFNKALTEKSNQK
jgi:hypothetical protein